MSLVTFVCHSRQRIAGRKTLAVSSGLRDDPGTMRSLAFSRLKELACSLMRRSFPLASTLCLLVSSQPRVMAQEGAEEVPAILIELLRSPDRDTRGLALQEIRESVPGEAATRKIAALVPTLEAEAQAALLETLGERGDAAARPVLLESAASPLENVRMSALRALGRLGGAEDVPCLAQRAAQASGTERDAARGSLVRLKGSAVDAAILALLPEATAPVKLELLRVLGPRKIDAAAPLVLQCAEDTDPALRLAAFHAAESLATPGQTAALAGLLRSRTTDVEREAAESALVALCRRGGIACLDALTAAWPGSEPLARVSLLRCLAALGGSKALASVAQALNDGSASVQDEALGILASWPDPAAAPVLLQAARQTGNRVRHEVALRGLVRLASAEDKRPADVRLLKQAWALAKEPDEQRLVLGAIGGTASVESLALAVGALDRLGLVEEAAMAAVQIAEQLPDVKRTESARAMRKVLERVENRALRLRAEEWLTKQSDASKTATAPR